MNYVCMSRLHQDAKAASSVRSNCNAKGVSGEICTTVNINPIGVGAPLELLIEFEKAQGKQREPAITFTSKHIENSLLQIRCYSPIKCATRKSVQKMKGQRGV